MTGYYGPGSRPTYQPPIVFPRTRQDSGWVQLERSTAIFGWRSDILSALGLIAFGVAVVVVLPFFVGGF